MKAAVTVSPGVIEIGDIAEPSPAPHEVVIEVAQVGICGSDFHLFHGDSPYARFPLVQGHEFAGVVGACGRDVPPGIAVGDRVAVEPLLPCTDCYPCRHGRRNCCANLSVIGAHVSGALAERVAVPASAVYSIGSLDFDLGAMVEPMSIGLQGVDRATVTSKDRVLVLGGGPIGQALLLAALDRGARVGLSDLLTSRRDLALDLGADATFDGADIDFADRVADWSDGDGPGVVIDATGVASVIRQAVDVVAPSGRIGILGVSTNSVELPIIEFTRKELTIVGSRNNTNLFGDAVDLVTRRADQVQRLITDRFDFADTAAAFDRAINHPSVVEKVQIAVRA